MSFLFGEDPPVNKSKEESFGPAEPSCLKTSRRVVAEYRKVRFRCKLILPQCFGGVARGSSLLGFYGGNND